MIQEDDIIDLRIIIYLAKKFAGKIHEDMLTIQYINSERVFICKYCECNSKLKQVFKTGKEGLFRYIETLVELTCMDENPFDEIHFLIPAYPSVLFFVNNFSKQKQGKMLNIFRDAVKNVILSSSQ